MDAFTDWYDELVDVETVTGQAGDWGSQTTVSNTEVPCRVENTDEVVIGNGTEVRAKSLILAAIEEMPKFTPGSKVSMPDGRTAIVLSVDSETADPDLSGITVRLA